MPIPSSAIQSRPGKGMAGLLVLATLILLPACAGSTDDEIGTNVTTEELIDAPTAIAGREVTIRSTVDQVLGDSVAAIDDPRIFSGGAVLVINNTGETFALPEPGVDLQLTGNVVETLEPALAAELNLNLEDEFYDDYQDKPVVIASSLALAPDPAEISESPETYYNQAIAVEGEVETLYGPTSFSLDEEALFGSEDLLVVGVPIDEAMVGQTVVVTGMLKPFVAAEFEADPELGWEGDTATEIEAEYSERPVMMSDGLYPMVE